ncbi:RDD family protein [Lysobacter claricitrinus]|uniref:RDD family protein n=1 Tax=Lysobacter claricitrinus TaxID=3367728 RepID=UPI0037DB6310
MELQNPYSAGDAAIAAAPRAQYTGEMAGKGRRFLTMLVDNILYYAACVAAVIVVMTFAGADAINGARVYAVTLPMFVLYYSGFEALFGRTPGKFICGTRVVTEHGAAPSFGQALGRTISRMIPFEPFSVLFSEEGRGWHDSIAKTKVIRAG